MIQVVVEMLDLTVMIEDTDELSVTVTHLDITVQVEEDDGGS